MAVMSTATESRETTRTTTTFKVSWPAPWAPAARLPCGYLPIGKSKPMDAIPNCYYVPGIDVDQPAPTAVSNWGSCCPEAGTATPSSGWLPASSNSLRASLSAIDSNYQSFLHANLFKQ